MQLVIRSGPGAGQHYNLGGKPATLGTDSASEIPVADTSMAAQHARFENIGGTLYVTDLASDKGTYLNGQRMSPAARYPLRAGDALQIGSTQFQILAPAPVAPPSITNPASPSGETPLQPYQYQISSTYSTVPRTAPAPTKPTETQPAKVVAPERRKFNLSAIVATVFVVGLFVGIMAYILLPTLTRPVEIKSGNQTSLPGATALRPTPTFAPPTVTPDQAGANFKGPTPGIGAEKSVAPVQVGASDVPVYPGARRIDNPGPGVYFTQYITNDSFDRLSDWAKTAFSDKGWTKVETKPLPGKDGAVLIGQKGNMSMVTYLLGPGQKDTAPYDNFFKSANVEPNSALVVINITLG